MTETKRPNPLTPMIGLPETLRLVASELAETSSARALMITAASQLEHQAGIMLTQQKALNDYLAKDAQPPAMPPPGEENLELLKRAEALPQQPDGDAQGDDPEPTT